MNWEINYMNLTELEYNNLKEYIRRDFYFSNHVKYRKYFEEWFSNLTDIQIEYWIKRMNGQIC